MSNSTILLANNLENAYDSAKQFALDHYENFPVISLTLPREVKKHIAVVYQFARQADDLADEGKINPEKRIQNLDLYEKRFSDCLSGQFITDFWMALKNTINECDLTPKYFYDLLSAFKQDVYTKRYHNYEQLLDYCSRSANPVGRIVLEICGIRNEAAFRHSDSICTGLQLTNFYQDVSVDWLKGRLYLPQDEMEKFGVTENLFDEKQNNANFKSLLKFQIERTRKLFADGRNLLQFLPGSFLRQIKMTILGGEKILDKIEAIDYAVLEQRPKLNKADFLKIFAKGLLSNVG